MAKHYRALKRPHNIGPKRKDIRGSSTEGSRNGELPLRGGLDFIRPSIQTEKEGNGHNASELTQAENSHIAHFPELRMDELKGALALEIRSAPGSDSPESERAGRHIEELCRRGAPFSDIIKVIYGAVNSSPEKSVSPSPERER